MRMDAEHDSIVDRGAILWRLAVAFGLVVVATLWTVPNMLDGAQNGNWFHYLGGLIGGTGLIVLASAINPKWFIARKPTARSVFVVVGSILAVQVIVSPWLDDMSTSFKLVLFGAACGVFLSQFVATYRATERARTS